MLHILVYCQLSEATIFITFNQSELITYQAKKSQLETIFENGLLKLIPKENVKLILLTYCKDSKVHILLCILLTYCKDSQVHILLCGNVYQEDNALLIEEGNSLLYLFDSKYHSNKTTALFSSRLARRSQDIINMSADDD